MKLANRVWCNGSGSEIPFAYRVRDRLPSGLYRCPVCDKDFKAYNPFSIQQRLAIPRHKREVPYSPSVTAETVVGAAIKRMAAEV